MAKEDITPEERLLKIIENPDIQKKPVPLAARIRSFGAGSIKEWFSGIRADKNLLKRINLSAINKMAAIICIIITLIWIFDFAGNGMAMSKRYKKISSGDYLDSREESDRPNIGVNKDEAVAQAMRRNIFTFLPTKEEAASVVNVGPTLGNFKLVGILWSDNPQAMIENSQEQKTYFVSNGDKISDLTVNKILRDKVMLGKDNQEWELR